MEGGKCWVAYPWALWRRHELCTLAAGFCTALPSPSGFSPTAVQSNYSSWESPLTLATLLSMQSAQRAQWSVRKTTSCRWKNVFGSQLLCVCACEHASFFKFYFRLPWVNRATQLFGLLCSTSSQFIVAIKNVIVYSLLCNHHCLQREKIVTGKN